MGIRKTPPPAKLIVGLLVKTPQQLVELENALVQAFGPIDIRMEPMLFSKTHFYEKELGNSPWRTFWAFSQTIAREALADAKIATQAIEQKAKDENGLRPFNLDPGIITLGQLFLASTKDQRQRVYLGRGIYVEPTLYYQDKGWHVFPWTYPDYAAGDYHPFFNQSRESLKSGLNLKGTPGGVPLE